MEHSDTVGGSGAAQFIYCPASYKLQQAIPRDDDGGSEFARLGNVLHDIMEWKLLALQAANKLVDKYTQKARIKEALDFSAYLGKTYDDFLITPELIETKLQPAMRAFIEMSVGAGGWAAVAFEIEVDLSAYIPRAFGTLDVMGIGNDGKYYAIDWKFGDGVPVSPRENMQLAYYSFGAAYGGSRTPEAEARIAPIRELIPAEGTFAVVFGIVQPRPDYADEPDYDTWETDSDWLERFGDLLASAWETAQTDVPPTAGPHCRWCRAKLICAAHRKPTLELLRSDDVNKPTHLTAVEMAHWLQRAPLIESFLKALYDRAEVEMYERNARIPGFKVVQGQGRRAFIDAEAQTVEATLVNLLGEEQAYAPRKIITPAQAEKAAGKEVYAEHLKRFVEIRSNTRKIVPQDDPRPALIEGNASVRALGEGIDKDANKDAVAALFAPKS